MVVVEVMNFDNTMAVYQAPAAKTSVTTQSKQSISHKRTIAYTEYYFRFQLNMACSPS